MYDVSLCEVHHRFQNLHNDSALDGSWYRDLEIILAYQSIKKNWWNSVIIIDIEAADRLQHDQQVASGDEFHD